LMAYARLASGYRPGGPNQAVGVPQEYSPDTTRDYEVGVKGDFLEHRLTYDVSLYYIDWKDIQLNLFSPNYQSYTANASEAKSQGVELSVETSPLRGMTVAAWVTWNDAQLTQGFPSNTQAYGVSGDRLPYSSRFSGYLSVNQEFLLTPDWRAAVGASFNYVGDRVGEFSTSPERQDLPNYTRTDLHAGLKHDAWNFNLYANNITNRQGVLSGGIAHYPPFAFQYVQPRTVGFSILRSF